jgi:hypothetical protein
MSTDYQAFAGQIRRLNQALGELTVHATTLGVPSPAGSEWFDLLQNKLLPQVDMPPLLVVAVVGGTNIGKSTIFNHLAGEVASAASPLAAGTKHPVCLTPSDLKDPSLLKRLFEPFVLRAWQSAEEPLADSPQNLLFWRAGDATPSRLLLLDAPDIDSDVEVNWRRARAIRQTADVLVAVLTQQKYNDAAVKQFFRAAVEADKPILVVFNQCDLDADRTYWPQWLATFCEQTGASPDLVYVVPYDRRAADNLQLPFYLVRHADAKDAGESRGKDRDPVAASLRDDLASLRFDAIKVRTFRGAIRRMLDPQHGLPSYLQSIRDAAAEFSAAETALSATEMTRVGWPSLPAGLLVEEIRAWWDAGRQPWSRQIHGFYRAVGRGATWPIRAAMDAVAGPSLDPMAAFRQRERDAIMLAVEKLLDELERLAKVGNDTLRPRLLRLLGGETRARLMARVQTVHETLPAIDQHYRDFLHSELNAWRASNPRAVRFLQSLDHVAALARPAITIGLFFTGLHFAGDLAGQAAAQAAGHTASHLATEAAIAGGITGGGEALVSSTSEGVRQAAGRLFVRLQSRYAQQRARWLADWLEEELLGDLLKDLHQGTAVGECEAFRAVKEVMATLVG